MSEAITAAEQGMQVYDRMGEEVMNRFVYHARRRVSTETLWDTAQSETLIDGSVIAVSRGEGRHPVYLFGWVEDDGTAFAYTRPVGMQEPPEPPPASYPIMAWPNTDTVQQYAWERAVNQASRDLNTGRQPEVTVITELGNRELAVMDQLAPALRPAVNHEILNEQCPQAGIDVLESFLHSYVDDALRRVPEDQWRALVDYCAHWLQGHPGEIDH